MKKHNKVLLAITGTAIVIGIVLVLSLNVCHCSIDSIEGFISEIYVDTHDGDITNVETEIEKSEKYSEEDINEAIEAVKEYFKEYFGGSTLHKLQYDESLSLREEKHLRKQNKDDRDYLILRSEFTTGKFTSPGLSPNQQYNYIWTLVKNEDNQWKVDSCGY